MSNNLQQDLATIRAFDEALQINEDENRATELLSHIRIGLADVKYADVDESVAGLLIDVIHASCEDWLRRETGADDDEAMIEPARELRYREGGPEVSTV